MSTPSTRERNKDAGMAVALLLLLAYAASKRQGYVIGAGAVLIVTMTVPAVLRPIAIAWFGLSQVLGAIASRVVMTIVFFLAVTPVGIVRRLLGHDAMRMREFRRGGGSVLTVRDHRVIESDLVHPY